MAITISQDCIFEISQIMNSRYEDEFYGYVDRKTGDILTGSQDYPLNIEPEEDDDDYEIAMEEFEHRYLPIPQQASVKAHQDMIDFIQTILDETLRDLLLAKINKKGAFSHFKNVIGLPKYKSEKERWFSFRDKCEHDRIAEWLAGNNLSLK